MEVLTYDDNIPDNKSAEFAKVKPHKVNEAMKLFSEDRFNVDVLKVEVPVNMNFVEGFSEGEVVYTKEEAAQHFRDQDEATHLPYIYLSAGVSAELFQDTLKFAHDSGAQFNGVLCGRATWSGAVKVYIEEGEQAAREWLRTVGFKNIDDLNTVLKTTATSWKTNNVREDIQMNRDEVQLLGFEIVAYAGDARSKLLEALNAAKDSEFDKAEQLVEEANECIANAHKAQTNLLAQEAKGEDIAYSITMIHGQDHLMTTLLLKDLMKHLIELYKKELTPMNKLIAWIEKGKPFFEKISRNIYLRAIRDGFIAAIPIILFSSIFILITYVPNVFGFTWSKTMEGILMKPYNYTMGIVGLLVAGTTAKSLTDSYNRKLDKTNQINFISTMMAAICGFYS